MIYHVRYTEAARQELMRLYRFVLEKDISAACEALNATRKAVSMLESFPYTCRKADPDHPFLREMLTSFGSSGYVALLNIDDDRTITVVALRHQREDDYH